MTDPVAPAVAATPATVTTTGMHAHHRFHFYLGYVFPLILLIVGAMFPVMRTSPTDVMSLTPDGRTALAGILFVELALGTGWLIHEFFLITNVQSTVEELRQNIHWSIGVALLLAIIFGAMAATSQMPWWLFLPFFFSVADAFITADRAFNNALQRRGGMVLEETHHR